VEYVLLLSYLETVLTNSEINVQNKIKQKKL